LLAKYLLNLLVADLRGLEGVSVFKYSGRVRVIRPGHLVLYGVNLGELVLAEGTQLRYYVKPLEYIDGEPLVLEVPYSNSILFAGYADGMGELAVRSVLYTCFRCSQVVVAGYVQLGAVLSAYP